MRQAIWYHFTASKHFDRFPSDVRIDSLKNVFNVTSQKYILERSASPQNLDVLIKKKGDTQTKLIKS